METVLHKADARGFAVFEWLDTKYSFSFADYYNPDMMGFGVLRVINDDIIAPGSGFDLHAHKNMEIITIILEGMLEHKDSMGHAKILRPGDVQHISAGRGIQHSEHNASKKVPASLLQIWINPARLNIAPSYNQRSFKFPENTLVTLVAPETKGTFNIAQAAYISRGVFTERFFYHLHDVHNGVYVFVISGSVSTGRMVAKSRDAIGIIQTDKCSITPAEKSDVLIIEIPMERAR